MLTCENEIFQYIKSKIESNDFEFDRESVFGVKYVNKDKIYITVPYCGWFRKTRKSLVQFCDDSLYFQGIRIYHPE